MSILTLFGAKHSATQPDDQHTVDDHLSDHQMEVAMNSGLGSALQQTAANKIAAVHFDNTPECQAQWISAKEAARTNNGYGTYNGFRINFNSGTGQALNTKAQFVFNKKLTDDQATKEVVQLYKFPQPEAVNPPMQPVVA